MFIISVLKHSQQSISSQYVCISYLCVYRHIYLQNDDNRKIRDICRSMCRVAISDTLAVLRESALSYVLFQMLWRFCMI